MSLILTGNSSSLTIDSTNGVTFPNTTIANTGNGPAFSAYANVGTSCAGGSNTKVAFQVEEFDTNNNFASSTFTPTIAGYYQINAGLVLSGNTNQAYGSILIYKNGSLYKQGQSFQSSSGASPVVTVNSLVYCNGTTDYVEIYASPATTITSGTGITAAYFNGVMVRGA